MRTICSPPQLKLSTGRVKTRKKRPTELIEGEADSAGSQCRCTAKMTAKVAIKNSWHCHGGQREQAPPAGQQPAVALHRRSDAEGEGHRHQKAEVTAAKQERVSDVVADQRRDRNVIDERAGRDCPSAGRAAKEQR